MAFLYIYKITNPAGQIYIGQTNNYEKRINTYKKIYSTVKKQKMLYKSLVHYGPENHKFECIFRNEFTNINICDTETFFINFFHSYYYEYLEKGLNLVKDARKIVRGYKYKMSEEVKKKLSNIHKGRKITKEQIEKRKKTMKNKYIDNPSMYDFLKTEEIKAHLLSYRLGSKHTEEAKKKCL